MKQKRTKRGLKASDCRNAPGERKARSAGRRVNGRPLLLSPRMRDALCERYGGGLSLTRCAHAVGLHPDTVCDWFARRLDFRAGMEKARALAIEVRLKQIDAGGVDDWRALAWRLERMAPEAFGKQPEVQVNVGATVVISQADLAQIQTRRKQALAASCVVHHEAS